MVRAHRPQADPRDLRPVGCRAGPHGRGRAARAGTSRQRRGGPAPDASTRRPVGGLDRALPAGAGESRVSVTARRVSQLRALEAEAAFVVREVVAELTRPVLLFSGGKDSIALLRVAEKAFAPLPLPFPVMHV